MRRNVELLLICVLFALPSCADEPALNLTQQERDDGWIELFDGRTLAGWQAGSKADWRVVDGAITATSGESGLLCSERLFGNFELRLEFRTTHKTNSGVFLRTPLVPTDPARDCYELNIAPPELSPFPTGSFVNRKKRSGEYQEKGDWQQYYIEARGGHFEVDLDGRKVLEYDDPTSLVAGRIGLQFRQGPIEFRRIAIRPAVAAFLPHLRRSSWEAPGHRPPVIRSTQL